MPRAPAHHGCHVPLHLSTSPSTTCLGACFHAGGKPGHVSAVAYIVCCFMLDMMDFAAHFLNVLSLSCTHGMLRILEHPLPTPFQAHFGVHFA